MVQQKSLGVFQAPAPLPSRLKPIYNIPKPADLAPTLSAPPRPLTAPELSLLSLFVKHSLPVLKRTTLPASLALLKSHLFHKSYDLAFASEELRETYVARWVPSRALIFRQVFRECKELREVVLAVGDSGERRILCLGGGAGSELVAVASLLSTLGEEGWTGKGTSLGREKGKVVVTAVDIVDWGTTLDKLEKASRAMIKWHLTQTRFSHVFLQTDLLLSPSSLSIPYSTSSLITLLFTLSELFLASRPRTLALLHHITASAQPGTLFLVIESSALSALGVPIGSKGRTYPLGTLLDHTLVGDPEGDEGDARMGGKWEVVKREEGVWYRMPKGTEEKYPIKLEGSRVDVRVYRRK